MWANRSFSPSFANQNSNPKKKIMHVGLNTTLPVQQTSPMTTTTRLRRIDATKNLSPLSGPLPCLLSSTFMPQIKRALGLETDQHKYSVCKHGNKGLAVMAPSSPVSPGVLPHVRLHKPRHLSLSQRNTSMLNRATVKIAPPVSGHVCSPSFYQSMAETSVVEDGSTPDTYAVVSALKERRKRSINVSDEAPELPSQQFKRRRQESQQSTASSSSLPGPPMPDNLPDLSALHFTMRVDTPGVKRPSRPSQSEDSTDWQRDASSKRPRSESRNNSILSSLSSSKRYLEKQNCKRKADTSLSEKENDGDSQVRKQRRDTVILPSDPPHTRPTIRQPEIDKGAPEKTVHRNGKQTTETQNTQISENGETGRLLKKSTSMKKSSSIYAGLSRVASLKTPLYANVVATADDYDADRETEQQRVKQILQDLDQSFTATTAKTQSTPNPTQTIELTKTDGSSALPTVPNAGSILPSPTTTGTASVSVTTVAKPVTTATASQSISAVTQSGGQETAGVTQSGGQETAGVTQSGGQKTAGQQEIGGDSSQTSGKTLATPTFKPLFEPVVTATETTKVAGFSSGVGAAAVSTSCDPKPGGFNFGLSSPGSTSSAPSSVIGQSPVSSTVIGGEMSLGVPSPFSFGTSHTAVSQPANASTAAATVINVRTGSTTTTQSSTTASLNFGTNLTSVAGSQPNVNFITGSTSATAATPGGFSLTGNTAPLSQGTCTTGLFAFNPMKTTAQSDANLSVRGNAPANTGFPFAVTSSVGCSTSTIGLLASAAATPAASGFSLGQTVAPPSTGSGFSFAPIPVASSVPAGPGFGTGPPSAAGGFTFGHVSPPTTTAGPAGPGFGAGPMSAAGSFNFNTSTPTTGLVSAAATSATSSTPVFGAPSGSAAPAFGMNPSTAGSSLFGSGPASCLAMSQPLFGNTTASSQAASQPLQFGASTTAIASTGFSFGTGNTTTPIPAFGAATTATATPAFGATSTAGFSFGVGTATSTAPSSPFPPVTQPTAATGFTFGQNQGTSAATGSAFQFGSASSTNAATAFGNPPVNESTFGAPSPAPAFGAPTPTFVAPSTQAGSVFGTAPKSNTPVFGASRNAPAFGAATTSATGFGKSHSMPVFSSTPTAGFTFGQNGTGPAPNVNPFGQQTTPVKQTGSVFGQTNNATPTQPPGNVIQFGQGTPATDSVSRGFDFSATSGGAGATTGFNFSANTSAFGTPGGTPGGFGSPNPGTFNVGTASSTPRPPRIMSKARRRTAKK